MNRWQYIILIGIGAVLLLVTAQIGCDRKKQTLFVAAASSLEYAFKEKLIPMFQERYPDITVEAAYDSSGRLKTQLEEGMEADVFLSAAAKQMDELVEQGLIEQASVTNILENQIVLIVPVSSEVTWKEFTDIAEADTAAIGNPDSVPAGMYAKEALTSLGIWEQVSQKASFGTNVTEVLSWVAEGSADAGIVYATDAATSDEVRVIAGAPKDSLPEPALYPAGIISKSKNMEAALKFSEFLKSEAALAVFEDYGFERCAKLQK